MHFGALRRMVLGAATLALIAAASWAVLLALRPPDSAEYWLRVADAREAAGEPAGDALGRALAASPLNARAWIRAGLAAEMAGDLPRAERCLLRAADASRMYEPAWTLANFYFRRNNPREFRRWMTRAAEMSYGDLRPLFDLAWRIGDDPAAILQALPPEGAAARAYLDYLTAADRLDAAQAAAARLCERASRDDRDALLRYVNRMLDAGRAPAALEAWNALCRRGALPYPPLEAGRAVTNGRFAREPLDAGFDWRLPRPHGIASAWSESPAHVRVWFSGKQPERCETLAQIVPVVPGRSYRLSYEYQTRGIRPGTGLAWTVYGAGGTILARAADLSSDDWKAKSASFTVPPATHAVRLALLYQRSPGTVRIEGEAALRSVSLEELP